MRILILFLFFLLNTCVRVGDANIVFEAEWANQVDGVIEHFKDSACSGGMGLEVREGKGAYYDEKQSADLSAKFPQAKFDNTPGKAFYKLNVDKSGDYILWSRVYWLWECSNSFWVSLAGAKEFQVTNREVYERWHWQKAPAIIRIEKGEYVFRIRNREDGIQIDQFCLTLDESYEPSGKLEPNVTLIPSASKEGIFMRATPVVPLVFSKTATCGSLWLRNNTSLPQTLKPSVEHDPSLKVELESKSEIRLAARTGIAQVRFKIFSAAPKPMKKTRVRFKATWKEGSHSTEIFLRHQPDWEVAGPFEDSLFDSFKNLLDSGESYPPAVKLKSLKWTTIADPKYFGPTGRIEFSKLFPGREGCYVYARAEFEWEKNESGTVELRSDDQSTLWLNGKLVCINSAVGPSDRYHTEGIFKIQKGKNRILLRVDQVKAYWDSGITLKTK